MENLHHSKEFYPCTSESYRPIKVRCPDCLKLYAVNPDQIQGSQPKFACVSCGKKFWIAYPESVGVGEVIGFPVEWLNNKPPSFATRQFLQKKTGAKLESEFQKNLIPCPKCQSLYTRGESECPHCGVLIAHWDRFQKLRQEKDQGFSASPVLRQAWEAVLDNYEDKGVHKEFLSICQREDNLVYASRQYGRLLSAHGGDEVAKKMRDQVVALSQAAFASTSNGKTKKAVQWNYGSFSSLILFFSVALIGIGFFLEPWRNMVGVGVALIFFTLAFRNRF